MLLCCRVAPPLPSPLLFQRAVPCSRQLQRLPICWLRTMHALATIDLREVTSGCGLAAAAAAAAWQLPGLAMPLAELGHQSMHWVLE